MKLKIVLSLLASFVIASSAQAAGNAKAGQDKAQACFACHGVNGNASNPVWPKLAGQNAGYLLKQLQDFKSSKQRTDPLMAGQVASLSEQDMEDLAAFFAAQKPTIGTADEVDFETGQRIYRGGNKVTGVAACMACHGPAGAGNPAARFPMLSGQNADYTVKQLKAFRSADRSNDAGKMMQNIAGNMTDKEIAAVASYMQGLH
ncbi:MAG: cytochrome c4 [Proteobacteria bacterium]|jgi:cytochrome c553|nr:cytochrome c4 [Pseudomonadota bacterium]MCG6934636.1 cytochrome c4 [Pseudomonadota bacterium]